MNNTPNILLHVQTIRSQLAGSGEQRTEPSVVVVDIVNFRTKTQTLPIIILFLLLKIANRHPKRAKWQV